MLAPKVQKLPTRIRSSFSWKELPLSNKQPCRNFKTLTLLHEESKLESYVQIPEETRTIVMTSAEFPGEKISDIRWYVREGEFVAKAMLLAEIETDTGTVRYRSKNDAIVKKLYYTNDDEIPVLDTIFAVLVPVVQSDPTPKAARRVGYAALLPFIAGAVGVVTLSPGLDGMAAFLQMTYGASILSCFGAVHWGLAMARYTANNRVEITRLKLSLQYCLAIVPALLAWSSLPLPPFQGMTVLLVGYSLALMGDIFASNQGLIPPWYLRLRIPFTLVVLTTLGVSYVKLM